ncbi:hypothetical protein K493DRAFT_301734 [Basidiobolus meristosporus CBS 931.73]|uniref:Uncharacterized protein n=1 Tax=Basidiobolus meristosporus CBS 931.73 TaxID=1314790 RepID=A0A1Y1YAP3_9FUNG|nr:hypothetical protein K493DRAFT_301734 [Basidiobolus meristosporus CBS 931.73]|eukprot:ORX94985.1 hypothetical protein K493DRAFT_301734 [Basidiobolus meristosporus CBS 931.73]
MYHATTPRLNPNINNEARDIILLYERHLLSSFAVGPLGYIAPIHQQGKNKNPIRKRIHPWGILTGPSSMYCNSISPVKYTVWAKGGVRQVDKLDTDELFGSKLVSELSIDEILGSFSQSDITSFQQQRMSYRAEVKVAVVEFQVTFAPQLALSNQLKVKQLIII